MGFTCQVGLTEIERIKPTATERFAEMFGQDAAAESRRSQESFKKWLLAGMTLVTGVVVGSLIAQKRL
ncbi:hypothetical protein KUCAC02_012221 [Chaenocephalus aceratus]|uniref:Uncharacterized protein n=1 Tax=Chaenocephalus aceratus TaxID=36190 RepID=A0ACB9XB82_CHAAC|nr:hypothetical protein KUCAC02_012221 [Chaenocephalus aceratus]